MFKLAYIFKNPPYGTSSSREGLDALLAATAFCDEEDIAVFFINEGILNLLPNQGPSRILQRNHTKSFKLLDLFDLENCFICQQSLTQLSIKPESLTINCQPKSLAEISNLLNRADKVFTF